MSEFRHEEKIMISKSDYYMMKSRLSKIFPKDPHVGTSGFYSIRSLYFDDHMDSALFDKINGVDKREKFRIRTYDEGSLYFLEKKSRLNGLCKKEKIPLTGSEVNDLLQKDPSFLRGKTNLERELYSKIIGAGLKPKVVVCYKRIPFVYKPGNVRITLDYDIRADYDISSFLNGSPESVPTGNTILMEVKWDEFLPDIARMAVKLNSRQPRAFSKYAACRMYG